MNILSKYAIFLTSSMLSCAALAIQQSWEDWYQVEVIIFSQTGPADKERHPSKMDISYPKNIRELKDLTTASRHFVNLGAPQNNIASKEEPFLVLEEKDLIMNHEHKKIISSQNYSILYHKSWRQPGLKEKESPWVSIKGGQNYGQNHELEGNIRLIKNNYLRFEADLWGKIFEKSKETKKRFFFFKDKIDTPANASIMEIFRLNQSTRVFANKETYLDHPKLGVIVLVAEYKKSEEAVQVKNIKHP
ncbi:MAG: hypothetical protein ACI9LL_000354 [Porticoccus sp.]|jgi:hypothetical protein